MKTIRAILSWLLGSVIVVVILGVATPWFVQVATDKDFYENAGARWDQLANSPIIRAVLYLLTFLAGLVAGLWLDSIWKRLRPKEDDLPLTPLPFDWDHLKQEVIRARQLVAKNQESNKFNADTERLDPVIWDDTAHAVFGVFRYLSARGILKSGFIGSLTSMRPNDLLELSERMLSSMETPIRLHDQESIPEMVSLAVNASLEDRRREARIKL